MSAKDLDEFKEKMDWAFSWKPAIDDMLHGHPEELANLLQDESIDVPMSVRKVIALYFTGKIKPRRKRKLRVWEGQKIWIAAIQYEKIRKRSWHKAVRFRAYEVERLAKLLGYTEKSMEKLFQKYSKEVEREFGIKS